jgi:endoglycosylceramidase
VPDAAPPARRTDPAAVVVRGVTFREAQGRQLIFRGYNAKVDGIFDVKFDDGRAPNYTFNSFDEASAQRFEELGFSALRLPISWSALEPAPLRYSAAFFDKVDAVLAMAKAHHFYVLFDMHQDSYSKEIGEDGAPLWAIVPAPTTLLSGPSDDSRRLSGPVLAAGFSFFADATASDGRSLQSAFIAAVSQIAKRYVGRPEVLGFEAFNEPVVLNGTQLGDFHARVADALHAIDGDAPALFEPIATRNQTDRAVEPPAPFSHGPGGYAPHIYTGWFSAPDQHGWESQDPAVLYASMEAANREALAWNCPLFITEFGCDQGAEKGPKWLAAELDLQDRFLASSTAWVWEEGGTWGLRDGARAEHAATVAVMARAYPRAVAGDLLAIEHPSAGRLTVRYRATESTKLLPHEVSASAAWVSDYKIVCDGVEVPAERATGRASFRCPWSPGDHVFELVGTPR